MDNVKLEAIHRFPVKGLPSQSLKKASLEIGFGIPGDRRYAITNGTIGTGEWMQASSFFVNAYSDGLAKFQISPETKSDLSIKNPEGNTLQIDPENAQSLDVANLQLERFLKHLSLKKDQPAPQIIERNKRLSNWDYPNTELSIINLATAEAIGQALAMPLDPARFRGNLIISGLKPWEEFTWLGKRVRLGTADIEVMFPIVRCPAPGVNPETGERDINFEQEFPELFGHAYCGMYAKVKKSGQTEVGDTIQEIGNASMPLAEAQSEADPYPLWPRMMEISEYSVDILSTRISLKKLDPWPLPDALPGQRLKIHMGAECWTREYLKTCSSEVYEIEVEDSKTGDPITQRLRDGLSVGDRVVVTGPFGRGNA
ncbi:MAG: MOSC domain-containing protein [Pseudomonadota bacterium]